MTSLRTVRVEQLDPRLGRHIEHDSRSKEYPARQLTGVRNRLWAHQAPVLKQDIGCCTGAAMAQLLNCSAMVLARRAGLGTTRYLTLAHAKELYAAATEIDDIAGQWPPDDTGSSGLGVAKAAVQLGYGSSYRHAFGFPHFLAAIQMAPMIVGPWWYQGMGKLARKAVAYPTGQRLGGHEYLCLGADFDTETLTFLNSWGASWGDNGRFRMAFRDFEKLLTDDGDATVLIGAVPKQMTPEAVSG